jgi:hypothetical protein
MMTWKYVGSCFDGLPLEIDGINVWKYRWNIVEPTSVHVMDPRYGLKFRFGVYEIVAEGNSVRFAAGEFSNGVWGFYSEDQHAE